MADSPIDDIKAMSFEVALRELETLEAHNRAVRQYQQRAR